MEIAVVWFRRDLRLEDNVALNRALQSGLPVLPIFVFDQQILIELPENDARVSFIYSTLQGIHHKLKESASSLGVFYGDVRSVWKDIVSKFNVKKVFYNRDYEPYALNRDREVSCFLAEQGLEVVSCKDQVVFEPDEVLKADGKPYLIYTPYKNKWLLRFTENDVAQTTSILDNYLKVDLLFPTLQSLGFVESEIKVQQFQLDDLSNYSKERDFPAQDKGSYLSPHLRFGTISVREVIRRTRGSDPVFLNEIIWREFFMQILYHFPKVVDHNFHQKYDTMQWRNDEDDFKRWCEGQTGYPMVDAGMRQLNTTGYMHNRVRMVVASFLCKHLLIDWRWGEAYFAEKLLDYDLSANIGNWQWAAGTGCDAAPYFRIFNPSEQLKKFDKNLSYTQKWVPEVLSGTYVAPMVDHRFARERTLSAFKNALQK